MKIVMRVDKSVRLRVVVVIAAVAWMWGGACCDVAQAAGGDLVFACRKDNDLYKVVCATWSKDFPRFDTPAEAVAKAPAGAGVLILADGYPEKTTPLAPGLFDRAAGKKLRLYVEYPESLAGLQVGKPASTHVERAVVTSAAFGGGPKALPIVSINGLHYVPVDVKQSHIVAARVAGFDHAVFGLPKKTAPILFEMPGRDVLVATTKLSHFVTGRYAPTESWKSIWHGVLTWLSPGAKVPPLEWTPTVRPTYGRDARLPRDYELQAIRRGVNWYRRAGMIVHPSFSKRIATTQRIRSLPADTPVGDGSLGSMEAVISVIHQDGTQSLSSVRRGDCICETAMAMAFGGRVLKDKASAATARNLLDYYLFESIARKNERGDPKHGAYGLIAWGVTTPAWYKANYGDDNARQIMGTIATAALNGTDRWDEAMMMCLLANLRTTGRLGFRTGRIDVGPLGRGWRPYFKGRPVNYSPHYEAYLWACFLWAYGQTGDTLFLDRAETALTMTMAQYTDGWRWTNGLAQEKARIILPLAWLVRAHDTPANRAMLRKAVDGLLALQDKSGAIREELGLPGRGAYPPPRSNAAYGKNEASLIARNGDPVTDLLYTANFAFLGLHEAAAATGDKDIIDAERKLAEFLCRIQVTSDVHPFVDGGWFRAFDFKRWEHWGSNADLGWGAWCIESGWTQGWIVSVLAMREMKTSLWDLTRNSAIEKHHAKYRKIMIPDDVLKAQEPKKVPHAAVGKSVKLAAQPSSMYPGSGPTTLTDGVLGSDDCKDHAWMGFWAQDIEATIDLGKITPIRQLGANFLQHVAVGIFLPVQVDFTVSADGKRFHPAATVKHDVDPRKAGPLIRMMTAPVNVRARYIRIRAKSIGKVPAWHSARGRKAWLFVDEVVVKG